MPDTGGNRATGQYSENIRGYGVIKQCTGTKNRKGCGKYKAVEEFSISNKNMCRECDNEYKRKTYHGIELDADPIAKTFNDILTRPWR